MCSHSDLRVVPYTVCKRRYRVDFQHLALLSAIVQLSWEGDEQDLLISMYATSQFRCKILGCFFSCIVSWLLTSEGASKIAQH